MFFSISLPQFPHCHLALAGGGGGGAVGGKTPRKAPAAKSPKQPAPTFGTTLPATPGFSFPTVATGGLQTLGTTAVFAAPVQLPTQPQMLNAFPWQPIQRGFQQCGDCMRGRPSFRCSGCSFSVCDDCEQLGRKWHHLAVTGPEHSFLKM